MAKRKAAARATKKPARRAKPARTAKPKKAAPARRSGKPAPKKAAKKPARKPVKARPKRAQAPRKTARKVSRPAARKPAKKAAPARSAAKKPAPRQKAAKAPVRKVAPAPKPAARSVAPARAVAVKAPVKTRKVPALDRERRTVADEDTRTGPPSSLDLDRTASSARSGRHEAAAHRKEVTQTGPDITAGDVDADWESAYSVGDEAPGGDNPTPDQDVVDEIGQALGVEYADDEELGGEGKISGRDDDRWELDPESSEDFEERDE